MSRAHDVTISAFDLDHLEKELAAMILQRDEARAQLEAERELADRLASELSDLWHNYSLWCDAYDDMEAMEAALTAWKEARDGSRQG